MSVDWILKNLIAMVVLVLSEGLNILVAEETTSTPEIDSNSPHGNKTVWEIHWPLFLGVLIFIAVSVLVTLICCVLLKVCKKRRVKQPEKIVADEPEFRTTYSGTHSQKPMSENQASGDPLPADEENGWIIPLDQMTPEELDQPEVPLSKV